MSSAEELTHSIHQLLRRSRHRTLLRISLVGILSLGCLSAVVWRLSLAEMHRGVLIGIGLFGLPAVGVWQWISGRREWLSTTHLVHDLDRTLSLDARLITASEFAQDPHPPALYPILLEETRHALTTASSKLPRVVDRRVVLLTAALLVLLWRPRSVDSPRTTAEAPPVKVGRKGVVIPEDCPRSHDCQAVVRGSLTQLAKHTPPQPQPQEPPTQPPDSPSEAPQQSHDQQRSQGSASQRQSGQGADQSQPPEPSSAQSSASTGGSDASSGAQDQPRQASQQTQQPSQHPSDALPNDADGSNGQPGQAGQQPDQQQAQPPTPQHDQRQASSSQRRATDEAKAPETSPDRQQQPTATGSEPRAADQARAEGGRDQKGRLPAEQSSKRTEAAQAGRLEAESASEREGRTERQQMAKASANGRPISDGPSPMDQRSQEALKVEIQQLLKQLSEELQSLQAHVNEQRIERPHPAPGTSTDPQLYDDSDIAPHADASQRRLPVQLRVDDHLAASRRPGGGVGEPSDEVDDATPQQLEEDAQLSAQAAEAEAVTRHAIPPEYQPVFDRLWSPTPSSGGATSRTPSPPLGGVARPAGSSQPEESSPP